MKEIEVSTEKARLSLPWVCSSLRASYWGKALNDAQICTAIEHSLCFGAYHVDGVQIGFARVVTDGAIFSSVMDVYVDWRYQRQGVGRKLMEAILAHPDVKGTISVLSTQDADGFYRKFGYRGVLAMKRNP